MGKIAFSCVPLALLHKLVYLFCYYDNLLGCNFTTEKSSELLKKI